MDSSKRRRICRNSTPFLRSFIGFRRSLPKRRIKRFIGDLFIVNDQNGEFLGKEKIFRLMLKFCVPCVLSLLVSALYNIVDQIFVGNSELSTLGNAATGVVFPIFIIAQGFAWYFGDGCAAFINIHQGKGYTQNIHKCVGTGIVVTVISSVILLAVFYPLKTRLLMLFGASENSIGYAVEYFNIILGFFPVYSVGLENCISPLLPVRLRWGLFRLYYLKPRPTQWWEYSANPPISPIPTIIGTLQERHSAYFFPL